MMICVKYEEVRHYRDEARCHKRMRRWQIKQRSCSGAERRRKSRKHQRLEVLEVNGCQGKPWNELFGGADIEPNQTIVCSVENCDLKPSWVWEGYKTSRGCTISRRWFLACSGALQRSNEIALDYSNPDIVGLCTYWAGPLNAKVDRRLPSKRLMYDCSGWSSYIS